MLLQHLSETGLSPLKLMLQATEVGTLETCLHGAVSVSPRKAQTTAPRAKLLLSNLVAKCAGTLLSPWFTLKSSVMSWVPPESTTLPHTPAVTLEPSQAFPTPL